MLDDTPPTPSPSAPVPQFIRQLGVSSCDNGDAVNNSIVSSTTSEKEVAAAAAAPEKEKKRASRYVESTTDCSEEEEGDDKCCSEEMEYGTEEQWEPNIWESESMVGGQDDDNEVWHEAERRYALAQAKEDEAMEEQVVSPSTSTTTTMITTTTTTTTTTTRKNARPQSMDDEEEEETPVMVEGEEEKSWCPRSKDDASNDLVKAALMSTLAASTRHGNLGRYSPILPHHHLYTSWFRLHPIIDADAMPATTTTTTTTTDCSPRSCTRISAAADGTINSVCCTGIFVFPAATNFYDDIHDGTTSTTSIIPGDDGAENLCAEV